jgi:hypothetical protein
MAPTVAPIQVRDFSGVAVAVAFGGPETVVVGCEIVFDWLSSVAELFSSGSGRVDHCGDGAVLVMKTFGTPTDV